MHAVRLFLGLIGFFRRFVEGYSIITEPLLRLTRNDIVFEWTKEQESSFRRLQNILMSEPVLTMFNPRAAVTELHTDASAAGLGAMLMQSERDGEPLKLVYCASRKQEFDYAVKYRPGTRMGHVDALSRAPADREDLPFDEVLGERYDVNLVLTEEDRVLMCQMADPGLVKLREDVVKGGRDDYVVENGLLYRKYSDKQLFLMPRNMRKSLVVVAHDLSGHPAVDRTVANVVQDFWFSGLRRYVRQHRRMCFECLLAKNPKGKRPGLLHTIPLGQRTFGTVHMDHVGPFTTTTEGNKYILAIVDNFTKFIVLYALMSTRAEPMVSCVKDVVKKYGFEEYCAAQGIQLVLTSSRHPHANEQVERAHSVVMAMLIARSDGVEEWDFELFDVQKKSTTVKVR